MHISIEHRDGKYPSFNINLHAKDGVDPFLVIRGCRIVQGSKGEFVSGPASKKSDGSYFNHTYMSDKFNSAVLEKARASMPRKASKPAPAAQADDDDIPF